VRGPVHTIEKMITTISAETLEKLKNREGRRSYGSPVNQYRRQERGSASFGRDEDPSLSYRWGKVWRDLDEQAASGGDH